MIFGKSCLIGTNLPLYSPYQWWIAPPKRLGAWELHLSPRSEANRARVSLTLLVGGLVFSAVYGMAGCLHRHECPSQDSYTPH